MVAPQAGEHGVWLGQITECTALPVATPEKFDVSLKCTLNKREVGSLSAKRVPIPCINVMYR